MKTKKITNRMVERATFVGLEGLLSCPSTEPEDDREEAFDELVEALEDNAPETQRSVDFAKERTAKDTNPKDADAATRIPLWLCSPIAKAHWALAQFAGFIKYGAWNWRSAGVRSSVYLSAAQRHLDAYLSGEEIDPVDGTHHLGNVMACCAIVLDAHAAGKLTDDRPPSVSLRPAYEALEELAKRLRAQYADRAPRHFTIADTSHENTPQIRAVVKTSR